MIKVKKLKYSNENFKNTLGSVTPIQDKDQKMGLDPFPSTADLAILANKAYSDNNGELRNGLPKDWKLLTAAHGKKGYFGCLYFNPSRQQVVLAHRGTVPLILGTVYADLKSVVLNKYTDYMFSAITLGDDIKCAVLNLNKQDGVRFTLTITGHSLGGWISQVTAITLKHLKRQGNVFVRVCNIDEGIHAHTVVFDSPGVQDMAIKIQRYYGRYESTTYSMFRSLDISTFFIAVNLVNDTGFHVGAMYQISSKLVCTPGFKHFLSNVSTHSMKNFIRAFETGNVKLFQVKDWPQGWGERTPVHELEKAQKIYYPVTKNEPSVRYNIGEEDPGTTVGLHRFSEVELDFLNLIRMVRQHKIPGSKIETFFGAEFQDLFPNFTINKTEKTVTLDNKPNLKKFVNNIKNSLRWSSDELQDVMKEQKKLTMPGFLLDMFSQECLDSIAVLPDCEDSLGLCEFINNRNTTRVLYVQAADCSLEMARIYALCNAYPDINIDECIFLSWERLLKLNNILKTKSKTLPLTNDHLNLFVLSIDSIADITLVEEVFKNLFSKFKEYSKKKAVIVSQKNSDLFNFVNSFEPELAIRCLPPSKEKCLEFTFKDLKDTSRRELLFSKEFIILGEQPMSLNSLLGENCQSLFSIDDVLRPFLKDVLMDESFSLNIPNNLLKFDHLDVMFSKINREVNLDSLTKLLTHEKTCSLFVSRGVRQLLEPLLQEMPSAAEIVLDVSGSSEEDFHQACLENPSVHIAYWLTATDGRIFLKELYNRSFYLLRQFHNHLVVDFKKLVQKKNYVDLFVFMGVTDEATLMRYLKASSEVENLFSTNLKFKRFQDSTTAENAEGIDRYVKHTLEVVKEGENYLLVWQNSQGSLDSLLPCLSSQLLSEENLCAYKTVIISDLPGMGKSTTLTSLSRHLVKSWVFRIILRDHPADIKNLPEQMSVESVAHFLAGASCEPATINLLRFCLQSQSSLQIHVLLDGFDEIRDEEAVEKILKLCHFLKNETTAKLIVTTRDTYKDVLVNRLSTVPTKFEEITKEIQLNFLMDFWHSHVVLGQKEERMRLFAQHLYETARDKLGRDIIGLIGIPLHTRMLAEAFLQQAEEFIDNAEPLPDIIGINNIYSLYNKFNSVKRDIYLKEKISLAANDLGNMLCEVLTVNHSVLAFEILDPWFKKKYLPMDEIYYDEMNRFGLTQWKRENHCDFIHRTFAEYFCSQLLVLWLRRDNFRYMYLPIEEWFLGNLLIQKDFKVTRKFMDEHLAEVTLAEESKKLLYDNMSKCWSEDTEAFRDEYGKTALHVAVEERNTNIIDLLLGGLVKEQTREPFESFLLARDYDGNTALKTGLKSLSASYRFGFGSILPFEKGIKQMLQITHLSYELKYKLLLHTVFKGDLLTRCYEFLLTCALNEKDQEDIQKALKRIEVLRNEVFSKVPVGWHKEQAIPIFIKNFILNEQNDIAERKILPLAKIHGKTAVNIEARAGNYELVNQFIQINHDVVNSKDDDQITPLHCAAMGDHIELVKFLQQHGATLNASNEDGYTALSFAAENGNLDIVKYLLEHGADSICKNGVNPLQCAIDGNNMDVIHLISSKENIDKRDGEDKTPLHSAISSRKWAIAKYLLESEADPDTLDMYGMTPLTSAVSEDLSSLNGTTDLTEVNQRMEILQKLISISKDNNKSDSDGRTLLHHAIKGGDKAVVEYIISEVKVDINCLDSEGKTPLHYTIEGGHEEIVKYLVSEVKVDINCSDKNGKTPLYYAVHRENWASAKYLLESGADSKVSDRDGETLLMYVVSVELRSLSFNTNSTKKNVRKNEGDRMKITQILMSMSVDINKSDRYGKTLLHYAIEGGDMEIVKCLIPQVQVVINCPDNKGSTPLHYAIKGGHEEIVKYLISEVKVVINCPDNKGRIPLHHALSRGYLSLAEYLLDSGADTNSSDCKGKTPLMNAVEEKFWSLDKFWSFDTSPSRLDIVKKIISISKDITTDINKSDHTGKTALHYAIEREKWTTAEYLLEAGADRDISDHAGKTPLDYVTDEYILNRLKSI